LARELDASHSSKKCRASHLPHTVVISPKEWRRPKGSLGSHLGLRDPVRAGPTCLTVNVTNFLATLFWQLFLLALMGLTIYVSCCLLGCKSIQALAHATFSKVICASLCTTLWVARRAESDVIQASLHAALWAARRLVSVARCSFDRAACLSQAKRFQQTHGPSKGASSSSSFIVLMRIVVLKGGR
jgi:hypothetical protein